MSCTIVAGCMRENGHSGKNFAITKTDTVRVVDSFDLIVRSPGDIRQITVTHNRDGCIDLLAVTAFVPGTIRACTLPYRPKNASHFDHRKGIAVERINVQYENARIELAEPDAVQQLCRELYKALKAPYYQYSQSVIM